VNVQVAIVVNALKNNVVTLIKDLNGNHVIQKCLNRLTSEQNQARCPGTPACVSSPRADHA
jgi:hypothetical protein